MKLAFAHARSGLKHRRGQHLVWVRVPPPGPGSRRRGVLTQRVGANRSKPPEGRLPGVEPKLRSWPVPGRASTGCLHECGRPPAGGAARA